MNPDQVDRELRRRVAEWRDELINLTRQNRLLFFRHTRSASLEITAPASSTILTTLEQGRHWEVFLPDADEGGGGGEQLFRPGRRPGARELVTDKLVAKDVLASLRALERKATEAYNERGVWTLYAGLGFLEWIDPADGRAATTPLLLVPVEFRRQSTRDEFRVWRREGDPAVNPALAVKLANDLGVIMPTVDDLDPLSVTTLMDQVRDAVGDRPGWSVRDGAVLHPFSFQKESMYRDLLDNEAVVLASPLVRALAPGAEPADPSTAPPDVAELDAAFPPEDLSHVLDADASQRRCVLAAKAGTSFVMDGPPGTGKSQTITNVISELLADGRTVLFVSEKAAALEVVKRRLDQCGLGEFVLELHSHNASRREVAKQLGDSLRRRPAVRAPAVDVAAIRRARDVLTAYTTAMNEVRPALGQTLHDVIGQASALSGSPLASCRAEAVAGLTDAERSEVLEHAGSLSRAWGPIVAGESFLWRDLTVRPTTTSELAALERSAYGAEEILGRLAARVAPVCSELGVSYDRTPAQAAVLVELLAAVEARPPVPAAWLSVAALDDVAEAIADGDARTEALATSGAEVVAVLGPGWTSLADDLGRRVDEALGAVDELVPEPGWPRGTGLAGTRNVAQALDATGAAFAELARLEAQLLAAFGTGGAGSRSPGRIVELARLASHAGSPTRPEAAWLDPLQVSSVHEAHHVLTALAADARRRIDDLMRTFKPEVFQLPLRELKASVTDGSLLGRFSSGRRADRKRLAAAVLAGSVTDEASARLDDAIAVQDLLAELARKEAVHAGVLGTHYYQGVDTDFARLQAAIGQAETALSLARDELAASQLAQVLSRTGTPDAAILRVAHDVDGLVERWQREIAPGLGPLASAVLAAPLAASLPRIVELRRRLAVLADLLEGIDAATGRPLSVDEARAGLAAADRFRQQAAAFESTGADRARLLGALDAGVRTDWSTARAALATAEQVRTVTGGPLAAPTAEALLATTVGAADVRTPLDAWTTARDQLLGIFDGAQRAALTSELGPGAYDDSRRLLVELGGTTGQAEEWVRFDDERRWFGSAGLAELVDFAIEKRLPADQVVPCVTRSVLEAWADTVLQSDGARLAPIRSADRDALVRRFRELDATLASRAAAIVIGRCADKRPKLIAGEASTIAREAEKQRRHLPIRTLLDRTRSVALNVKPCFMMSPLAVSQYLPADLRFDVVIFDEASQVRPCDAINCLYRGDQLVVAGDQKQLPPTSFFDRANEDLDDTWDEEDPEQFESLLDIAKASGGFLSLPLTWHYRSMHESLITFSNHEFYDGSLNTFPSARIEGPDVGVELFHVPGVYDRGHTRANLVEAANVVERVLHHQAEHPHLTIGVVTMSVAQQEAVNAALEAAAPDNAELAGMVNADRLGGLFVKNLENVQGDERDIIILSVGYGPDASGRLTSTFGPINRAGGWRRLNVAVTRARYRIEVVASFLPGQMPVSTNESVNHLRSYLDYAIRGVTALRGPTDARADLLGPFELDVAAVVRSWGHDVELGVGDAEYRVDVAVRHPVEPGRYALGIECDGRSYLNPPVTRDRDRLRPEVLAGLGWRQHHVWGAAWLHDRSGEERRLREAINAAITSGPAPAVGRTSRPVRPVPVDEPVVEDYVRDWAVPYRLAQVSAVHSGYDLDDPGARPELLRVIEEVVRQEGPVEIDRVLAAVKLAWGVKRAGSRIQGAFGAAVTTLSRTRLEVRFERFLAVRDTEVSPAVVRVPVPGVPSTVRSVADVPPSELDVAVANVVEEAVTVSPDELAVIVSRLFGWQRTTREIDSAVDRSIQRLVALGHLTHHGDLLTPADR